VREPEAHIASGRQRELKGERRKAKESKREESQGCDEEWFTNMGMGQSKGSEKEIRTQSFSEILLFSK